MTRLFLLLSLALLSCGLHAENYARRDEVQAFVADMQVRHGLNAEVLMELFRRTRPVPAVLKAIMPPKDPAVRSWHVYRARFVEPKRIAAGRHFMQTWAVQLANAEHSFGVPAEIIAAIIGVETIYGKQLGRFNTFAALATLAFDYPPRAELFRKELEELLLLAREEDRSPLSYTGSYAGAIGLPQFLPSSRRRFAVDFDKDGRIDLTGSRSDTIGSVANFLAAHGWQRNAPISVVVGVSGDGIPALIEEGIVPRRTPGQMQSNAVRIQKVMSTAAPETASLADRGGDMPIPDLPAALIDLVTPGAATEYRLGYGNFYVITRYNRSSFYASVVMDLAVALSASE